MVDINKLAKAINALGDFCGARDVAELTPEALRAAYGIERADVMALFGGSIMCGCDALAEAMRRGVARRYAIVGGEGHTTDTLRRRAKALYPDIDTAHMAESEVFSALLWRRYGLRPDFIETRSTNCGNNITNMLALLDENGVRCDSIILAQDATMQRRMAAGLQKYRPDARIISYATYHAVVESDGDALRYANQIDGMWDIERYVSLLMGEIPRLRDDADGYGPNGSGFIAHVDIPQYISEAFETLRDSGIGVVRDANPLYATR